MNLRGAFPNAWRLHHCKYAWLGDLNTTGDAILWHASGVLTVVLSD
jgi:hypothetical protein